jgi:hypothetical protein
MAFERCAEIASASDPFLDDAVLASVLAYENALSVAEALGETDDDLRAAARNLFERVIAEHPQSEAAALAGRLLSSADASAE